MYTHTTHMCTHIYLKPLQDMQRLMKSWRKEAAGVKVGSVRDNLVRYLCLTWSSMVLRWLGFEFNLKPLPSYAFWISC